jgi:bacitracin transport system permease protein
MLTLIAVEFKKLKRSRILYIVLCTMLLFYLCASAQGIKAAYDAERLMDETLIYATFLIAPALFSLLGSYMISRDTIDDTMKSLRIIPVNTHRLLCAKLLASLLIGIILFLFLFAFTLITAAFMHAGQITAAFTFIKLKVFLLQGAGCFAAALPMIALMSMVKSGYWISALFAEIYSFAGLIAASSRFRNIYPVSAVFGFSGASPAAGGENFLCLFSLGAAAFAGLAILRGAAK